ncbi:hypothetical protein LAZ67_4002451 [Cordylochernes scorpioides]|uniref:DDE-1 domain-containing protein n=1 Tax=Cordylochernes scorpioides TaxID=51811 RepID=A0ABY6KDT7_9ARAC|nr:hypothetical protein LAZ67_4002451 [Cordylochernes scorpioides]
MPTKSLVAKNEMSAPGYKASKSRITAIVCGNINETHRLPLLSIGKFANPRCFKGIKNGLLSIRNKRTRGLVQTFYRVIATGKSGNVLLLIDNAPSHSLNISMERENLKLLFSLLAKLCTWQQKFWATLKDTTLAKSWNKLLPSEKSITASEELPNSQFVSEKDIQDWLECDVDDPGYQLLTDDKIIESVVDDQCNSDNEEELRDDHQVEKGPPNEETFHCFETAMKWLEQQEECNTVQLLFKAFARFRGQKTNISSEPKENSRLFHEL